MDLHIVLHGEEHKGMDQGHHGLAASGGLGHNMYYRCIITIKEQALPFQLGVLESQGHVGCIQLTPVNTYLLVSKALLGEGTLAPLPLEVTPQALVTGICEQLHIWGTIPVCIVEEANPIPAGEVGEPPHNIILKFCI